MAERRATLRCGIYTRKSSEEGLEQSFNSLDAQREACLAYIESQRHEGWKALHTPYDDGGFSGGTLERPALTALLRDVEAGEIDVVVVYKVDRLTRALADFAKIVEIFDAAGVSFVSVTQQFNTTSSMGRLTLNVLLSFAQFEREVTGERIRDKIAASKKKGLWMGGMIPLGYDLDDCKLIVNPTEAEQVRTIFRRYLALGCVTKLQAELKTRGITSKRRVSKTGRQSGGQPYSRGALYDLLNARIYLGEITHKGASYPGQHEAIIDQALWDRVHAKLSENRRAKRNGTHAKEPSLLAGLIYDDTGHRMTPSHTIRRGRRYRYYVSQALIRQGEKPCPATGRVSAYELEKAVMERLQQLLESPNKLLKALQAEEESAETQKALTSHARSLSTELPQKPPSEQRELLLAILWRVTLHEQNITLELDRGHLRAMLLGRQISTRRLKGYRPQPEQLIRLRANIHLKRRSNETKLVMTLNDKTDPTVEPSPALVKAIALAHSAWGSLLKGEARTLKELAEHYGLHRKYLQRILPLTFLAPEIVESLLKGDKKIKRIAANQQIQLPISWLEQRQWVVEVE